MSNTLIDLEDLTTDLRPLTEEALPTSLKFVRERSRGQKPVMASTSLKQDDEIETAGVRLVTLNLPDDEGEGIGFRITRTLWDPYPWVRDVTRNSRAELSGLKTGDCILQADGKDLLGLPVSQVAGVIRGDGTSRGISLLVWSCGHDPREDPELLWSCGGGIRGERARRALSSVLTALGCCVCGATVSNPNCCRRSHIYCEGCWTRLQRCALCREPLPPKDSPYVRNLVAEQVFEAIATEYEIKDTLRKPIETVSARSSPQISPHINRKGQYQVSMMQKTKKSVQFGDRFNQNYASDPNLSQRAIPKYTRQHSLSNGENSTASNTSCQNCQSCTCKTLRQKDDAFSQQSKNNENQSVNGSLRNLQVQGLQHKLLARLRPACSLADLKNDKIESCSLSRSLNNISTDKCDNKNCHSVSLDNIKIKCSGCCDNTPVFVVSTPPIYLISCDHGSNENVTTKLN